MSFLAAGHRGGLWAYSHNCWPCRLFPLLKQQSHECWSKGTISHTVFLQCLCLTFRHCEQLAFSDFFKVKITNSLSSSFAFYQYNSPIKCSVSPICAHSCTALSLGLGWEQCFGDFIRPIPCDCTHCHHQFLGCSEKTWNLTAAWFDTNLDYSIPNRVLSKLKNVWKSIICILIHLSSRYSQALMLRSFILYLNVSMVRNPTEISGTLSTERNLFCNSFLNVIPNPCCLHTFSFSIPINDIFSCWKMPYDITQQSLFWKSVSLNSQSHSRDLFQVVKKPFQTEVSLL